MIGGVRFPFLLREANDIMRSELGKERLSSKTEEDREDRLEERHFRNFISKSSN